MTLSLKMKVQTVKRGKEKQAVIDEEMFIPLAGMRPMHRLENLAVPLFFLVTF